MTLVIGFGNPGRGDDGIGPELAARLSRRQLPGIRVLSDFQLKVEHAIEIARSRRVVFADASVAATSPFEFTRLEALADADLGSHSIGPTALMALAEFYFKATCPAFLLAIAGTDFDRIQDGLSASAERNLACAEVFLLDWLADKPVLPEEQSCAGA